MSQKECGRRSADVFLDVIDLIARDEGGEADEDTGDSGQPDEEIDALLHKGIQAN